MDPRKWARRKVGRRIWNNSRVAEGLEVAKHKNQILKTLTEALLREKRVFDKCFFSKHKCSSFFLNFLGIFKGHTQLPHPNLVLWWRITPYSVLDFVVWGLNPGLQSLRASPLNILSAIAFLNLSYSWRKTIKGWHKHKMFTFFYKREKMVATERKKP